MSTKVNQNKRRKTSKDDKPVAATPASQIRDLNQMQAVMLEEEEKERQRREVNKRINKLCKSKHTLLRRAYELASSCQQQVYIVIYDPELDRLT